MARSLESPPVTPPSPTTIHLRPTADLAERVLLPGDPGRALALAQSLLERPLMFNHNRGLWGYSGTAADGEPLTIQSTGMGGPSAAIVLSELIALGVRRAIRVGTCGALHPALGLGDLLVARESICLDGTSLALGAGERASADVPLTEALAHTCARAPATKPAKDAPMTEPTKDPRARDVSVEPLAARAHAHAGTIVSVDLFYEPDPEQSVRASAPAALAVEMEAAALFALGARARVPVACLLAVSDTFSPTGTRQRIDDESLLAAAEAMGAVAVAALST
jgi:uridine phosphorylase